MKSKTFPFGRLMAVVACGFVCMSCSDSSMNSSDSSMNSSDSSMNSSDSSMNSNAIFAKARAARAEGNIDFCGFYVGMELRDAFALAKYYELKDDEYWLYGDPVWCLRFSPHAVRRITNGGNTESELHQAVANRVGDFEQASRNSFVHRTIDGFSIRLTHGYVEMNGPDRIRERSIANVKAGFMAKRPKIDAKGILSSMVQIPDQPFLMGKTEVTKALWFAVIGDIPGESWDQEPDLSYPVVGVSWNDCQKFLQKLNALPCVKETGLTFRLPTEEEWEYACRAGATGDYCQLANGTEITEDTLGQVAWFEDNADSKTHPVRQKQPNAFGLYDMHGNIWEWTQTAVGGNSVYRGGGWDDSAGCCVSSFRFRDLPDARSDSVGFRLCASGRAD